MLPVKGLYGHIAKNNALSLALVLAFVGSALAIGKAAFFALMSIVAFAPTSLLGKTVNGEFTAMQLHYQRSSGGLIGEVGWIVIVLSTAYVAIGVIFHRRIIQHFVGTAGIERRDEKRLHGMVEALAISAGLPTPRVEVIESDAMNAYACGWSPKRATIAVTRGLLRGLDDAELNAVLAHEMTHIRNRDTRLSVLSALLGGMIRTQAEAIWLLMRQKTDIGRIFAPRKTAVKAEGTTMGGRFVRVVILYLVGLVFFRSVLPELTGGLGPPGSFARQVISVANNAFVLIAICYVLLAGKGGLSDGYKDEDPWAKSEEPLGVTAAMPRVWWLLSPPFWIIVFASKLYVAALYAVGARTQSSISRAREFMADAGAVELTKDPDALITALRKITGRETVDMVPACFNAMMIAGPQEVTYPTHPTIEARIDALVKYAAANGHVVRGGARRGSVGAQRFSMPLPNGARAAFGKRPARVGV